MSETRTINCPRCNEPIDYSSKEEGKVSTCPNCQEKIWYSKLVHPTHGDKAATEQSVHTSGITPEASSGPRSTVIWVLVALFGLFIAFDNYRLRSELRSLGQEIRSLHTEPRGNEQASSNQSAALARAELNQVQLEAIVSEVNAIEAVIESKLNQFTKRSTEDATKIEAFANSLETVMDEFEQLELSITEIQDAMNSIMDNYDRLETELLNRQ